MRPALLIPIVALAAISLSQGSKPRAQTPVGVWKYDLTTLNLQFNARAKKEMSDQAHGKQAEGPLRRTKAAIESALKNLRLNFKSNHSLEITAQGSSTKVLGTWSMDGPAVKVVMTNAKQQTPHLVLARAGMRMTATYTDPSFGIAQVILIRG